MSPYRTPWETPVGRRRDPDMIVVVVLVGVFVLLGAGGIVDCVRDCETRRAKTAATARKVSLTTTPQMWEVRP